MLTHDGIQSRLSIKLMRIRFLAIFSQELKENIFFKDKQFH